MNFILIFNFAILISSCSLNPIHNQLNFNDNVAVHASSVRTDNENHHGARDNDHLIKTNSTSQKSFDEPNTVVASAVDTSNTSTPLMNANILDPGNQSLAGDDKELFEDSEEVDFLQDEEEEKRLIDSMTKETKENNESTDKEIFLKKDEQKNGENTESSLNTETNGSLVDDLSNKGDAEAKEKKIQENVNDKINEEDVLEDDRWKDGLLNELSEKISGTTMTAEITENQSAINSKDGSVHKEVTSGKEKLFEGKLEENSKIEFVDEVKTEERKDDDAPFTDGHQKEPQYKVETQPTDDEIRPEVAETEKLSNDQPMKESHEKGPTMPVEISETQSPIEPGNGSVHSEVIAEKENIKDKLDGDEDSKTKLVDDEGPVEEFQDSYVTSTNDHQKYLEDEEVESHQTDDEGKPEFVDNEKASNAELLKEPYEKIFETQPSIGPNHGSVHSEFTDEKENILDKPEEQNLKIELVDEEGPTEKLVYDNEVTTTSDHQQYPENEPTDGEFKPELVGNEEVSALESAKELLEDPAEMTTPANVMESQSPIDPKDGSINNGVIGGKENFRVKFKGEDAESEFIGEKRPIEEFGDKKIGTIDDPQTYSEDDVVNELPDDKIKPGLVEIDTISNAYPVKESHQSEVLEDNQKYKNPIETTSAEVTENVTPSSGLQGETVNNIISQDNKIVQVEEDTSNSRIQDDIITEKFQGDDVPITEDEQKNVDDEVENQPTDDLLAGTENVSNIDPLKESLNENPKFEKPAGSVTAADIIPIPTITNSDDESASNVNGEGNSVSQEIEEGVNSITIGDNGTHEQGKPAENTSLATEAAVYNISAKSKYKNKINEKVEDIPMQSVDTVDGQLLEPVDNNIVQEDEDVLTKTDAHVPPLVPPLYNKKRPGKPITIGQSSNIRPTPIKFSPRPPPIFQLLNPFSMKVTNIYNMLQGYVSTLPCNDPVTSVLEKVMIFLGDDLHLFQLPPIIWCNIVLTKPLQQLLIPRPPSRTSYLPVLPNRMAPTGRSKRRRYT